MSRIIKIRVKKSKNRTSKNRTGFNNWREFIEALPYGVADLIIGKICISNQRLGSGQILHEFIENVWRESIKEFDDFAVLGRPLSLTKSLFFDPAICCEMEEDWAHPYDDDGEFDGNLQSLFVVLQPAHKAFENDTVVLARPLTGYCVKKSTYLLWFLNPKMGLNILHTDTWERA